MLLIPSVALSMCAQVSLSHVSGYQEALQCPYLNRLCEVEHLVVAHTLQPLKLNLAFVLIYISYAKEKIGIFSELQGRPHSSSQIFSIVIHSF